MQTSILLFTVLFGALLNVSVGKVDGTAEANVVAVAETSSNATSASDLKTAASAPANYYTVPSFLPDYWRSSFGQALVVGGIIVSTMAILGGLTWLFAPSFGLRMCQLLGNCEKTAIAHSNGGNLQDPSVQANSFSDMQSYMYPGAYNVAGYNKRSINYIGPILKTLASAYEKYEHSASPKKE